MTLSAELLARAARLGQLEPLPGYARMAARGSPAPSTGRIRARARRGPAIFPCCCERVRMAARGTGGLARKQLSLRVGT
jgi:hypothetical protein